MDVRAYLSSLGREGEYTYSWPDSPIKIFVTINENVGEEGPSFLELAADSDGGICPLIPRETASLQHPILGTAVAWTHYPPPSPLGQAKL